MSDVSKGGVFRAATGFHANIANTQQRRQMAVGAYQVDGYGFRFRKHATFVLIYETDITVQTIAVHGWLLPFPVESFLIVHRRTFKVFE